MKLKTFLQSDSGAGTLLVVAAVLAMVVANSSLATPYAATLAADLKIGFGALSLSKSVLHWINDGLMAVFFLFVGLEIKRELLDGELSDRRRAALPVFGAIGGMVVPALIYAFVNAGSPDTLVGWPIPAATDIAFALDSIPAAFAITEDPLVIWAANGFALLGLRALFSLVEDLIKRFRYLNQTVAIVLGVVALKLLIQDVYKASAPVSLAIVIGLFAAGITLSVIADRRDGVGPSAS